MTNRNTDGCLRAKITRTRCKVGRSSLSYQTRRRVLLCYKSSYSNSSVIDSTGTEHEDDVTLEAGRTGERWNARSKDRLCLTTPEHGQGTLRLMTSKDHSCCEVQDMPVM